MLKFFAASSSTFKLLHNYFDIFVYKKNIFGYYYTILFKFLDFSVKLFFSYKLKMRQIHLLFLKAFYEAPALVSNLMLMIMLKSTQRRLISGTILSFAKPRGGGRSSFLLRA